MSETIIAEHTAVRINRTMLAGYLHQSLQQVCKLASGLKILRLPASDTTRRYSQSRSTLPPGYALPNSSLWRRTRSATTCCDAFVMHPA